MAAYEWMYWLRPLLTLGFLCGLLPLSFGNQVTLLDTSTQEGLGWTTYKDTDSVTGSRQPRGWREASYNTKSGDSLRVYTVCDIAVTGVNNWIRTPYIPRGDANRLYVEMKFTMRKCTKYPEPGRLQQCKESFKLLSYEAESDFANHMMPTWDSDTYRHMDVVAADKVFTDNTDTTINTETRSVAITRRGVYFAFQDQGACATLLSVRVYYIMCPRVVLNYAVFPNTTTGPDMSSVVQKSGSCVSHAAIEQPPSYLCKGDGTWDYLSGGCKCMPGYEPSVRGQEQVCAACGVGRYKWRTGSEACRSCPPHSEAPNEGSVECQCVHQYYRHINDDKSMPCTTPPTVPRNLTAVDKDQSMVYLTWQHPENLGGRRDILYKVECVNCGSNIKYAPKQSEKFNATHVTLSGLMPNTRYKIVVTAENGVSAQSDVESSSYIYVTTEAAIPSKVRNLRVARVGMDFITVAWDAPAEPHVQITEYEILRTVKNRKDNISRETTGRQNYTFTGLAQQTEYLFQVRGKTTKGWGEYSNHVSAITGHLAGINKVNTQSDSPVGIIAGSAVAVVVCMVIVIIMVIIFLRRNFKQVLKSSKYPYKYRNHRACNEKNVSDCDTLQYSNVQCPHVLEGSHMLNGGLTVPLFTPPGGVKTYVDPHTYEDPNQAVREFTKEIDASCITIEAVIGGGEFGDVCKGKLKVPGKGELTVAIKTLKAGASDKNRLDFLTEASIMGQFDDPNVIYLEGVVTKSNPIMIVTEFMENGSLDNFLRNNDGKFTTLQLVGMMRGIASGMRYLSEMGYVHRDLAARNILVNESLVCKVADFGLSREVESDDTDGAYTTKGGKIPVRWTAPEAIAYRKFTSASDVWSYGVVMWEVMAFAERPYWNWSNQDVIKAVEKSFRLPPPMDCPEAVYQLMLDCWQKERSHRPKFTSIVKTLDKLIRAPELLRKIAKPKPHQLLDPNTPDLTSYDSIEEWLTSIKMERYIDHFLQSGYNNMDQVAHITPKDLVNLGVTLIGHQKKIMNSVQTLRAQLFGAQMSDGFMV